jgi:hypothetical protein
MLTGCATDQFYVGEVPREPLDRLWENHMLEGTRARYIEGKRDDSEPFVSPKATPGSPLAVVYGPRGISVFEDKGTALLGLLQGSGWILKGGLIGQVEETTSTLELYGRVVWPLHAVPLGIGGPRLRPKEEETYDFFLLRRGRGAPRATVLAKWTIQPNEIAWFLPEHVLEGPLAKDETYRRLNEDNDVRGVLKYIPETQEAEVTIKGLTHPFVERVKVELK